MAAARPADRDLGAGAMDLIDQRQPRRAIVAMPISWRWRRYSRRRHLDGDEADAAAGAGR
jgi:hypothetical protein